MENINKIEICNSYQESICIDKTVACSIQVKNMDQSSKGYFKIEKIFSSGVSDEETFDSEIQEFLLSPLESITLTANTSITSEGEGGLANKQINCFFYTRGNPYKEFC